MGSGTLGLQCCEKRFYSLPDHVRANGSSGDPTDQASLESLIYRISPQQRFNHIHRLGFTGSNQAVVRTSDREPDGAGHCSPSKCPDQDWWHQVGTQRSSEAPLTYPAARAAARWKHHAGNSPIHQNEQPERKPAAPQQQSTNQPGVGTTSGFKIPVRWPSTQAITMR